MSKTSTSAGSKSAASSISENGAVELISISRPRRLKPKPMTASKSALPRLSSRTQMDNGVNQNAKARPSSVKSSSRLSSQKGVPSARGIARAPSRAPFSQMTNAIQTPTASLGKSKKTLQSRPSLLPRSSTTIVKSSARAYHDNPEGDTDRSSKKYAYRVHTRVDKQSTEKGKISRAETTTGIIPQKSFANCSLNNSDEISKKYSSREERSRSPSSILQPRDIGQNEYRFSKTSKRLSFMPTADRTVPSPLTASTAVIRAHSEPDHVPFNKAMSSANNKGKAANVSDSQAYPPMNAPKIKTDFRSISSPFIGDIDHTTTSFTGNRTSISALLPRSVPIKSVAPLCIRKKGSKKEQVVYAPRFSRDITLSSLPTQIIEHSPPKAEPDSSLSLALVKHTATSSRHSGKFIWTMADEMHLVRNRGILAPSEKLTPHPEHRTIALCLRRYNGVAPDEPKPAQRKSMSIPAHLMGVGTPSNDNWSDQERKFLRRQKVLDQIKLTGGQSKLKINSEKKDGAIVTTSARSSTASPYILHTSNISKIIPTRAKSLVRLFSARNLTKILSSE